MEAAFDELHPARPFRTGKPGHFHRRASLGVALRNDTASGGAHFHPGYAHLGGDAGIGDIIDRCDHGDIPGDLEDRIGQRVIGDGSEDKRIHTFGHAVDDLLSLTVKIGIAARLDQLEGHTQPARLFDHPVIDAEPIGILEMRVGDTKRPVLLRGVEWRVGHDIAWPLVVERRLRNLQLPRGGCGRQRGHDEKKNTEPAHG